MSTNATRSRPAPSRRRWPIAAGALVAGGAALLWVLRDSPERLVARGRQLLPGDPRAAETYFARSIEAAGGEFPQGQVMLARSLAARGEWTAALGAISQIGRMSECDPADLLLLAREALAHGEPLLADLCLSGARTDTPLRVEILRLLLPLHIRDERTQQAHRDAALLEKLSPADPLPARVRGVLHARAREPAAAAAEFRDALRLATSPEPVREIRRELVEQLLEAGELSQARVELDSLLEGAAPSAEALVSNARLLRLEGKPDLALAAAKHACALRPDLDQAHVMAGVLHFDAGQFDQAAVGFEKALRLDPFNAQAHYLLAQVCRRQGRDAQALDHERASREISSATAEIAALKLAIAERPRDRASFERLAHLFEKTGRETEAARVRAAMPPDTH